MPERTVADVDAIFEGQASGSLAAKLLAANMDPNALRTNDLLKYHEWQEIDAAVQSIATKRLTGVTDLVNEGCVYNLVDGLGSTVLVSQKSSDMSAAAVSMDAAIATDKDRVEFDPVYLPLPIVHKGFDLNIRQLKAGRKDGQPIDVTSTQIATRKVAEKIEAMLFNGIGTFTYGGGSVEGYLNATGRNTGSLAPHWDHTAATGATILADVIRMKAAANADNFFGPFYLYVPVGYESALDNDFKAASDLTVRQRLLEVEGIKAVKTSDWLTADNVVLVAMQPETVRIVIGLQPMAVEWDTHGGLTSHFKVMSIMVPQIRTDAAGNSGVVHFS